MGATGTGRRPLALGAGVSLLAMLVGCGEAQSPAPIGEQPVARAEPSPTPPLSAPGRMPQSSETTMSAPSRPGSAPARPESIDDRVDAIEAIPFSERDPERAIEKIRPWLAHEDLDVREAAVMALSAVSGDGATEALSEHARVERS